MGPEVRRSLPNVHLFLNALRPYTSLNIALVSSDRRHFFGQCLGVLYPENTSVEDALGPTANQAKGHPQGQGSGHQSHTGERLV